MSNSPTLLLLFRINDLRTARAAQPAHSPEGAWEIQKLLRGDIATGEMNEDGLRELRHEVERFAANQSSNNRATDHYWNELGPDNIGGRVRAIAAIIPEDGSEEQVLYAGSYLVDCGRVTTEVMTGTRFWHRSDDDRIHRHHQERPRICGFRFVVRRWTVRAEALPWPRYLLVC